LKRLIVNADDLGIGERISDAIFDCHANGIVTSATLMANMPAAEYACRRLQEFSGLGVGIHLNLTQGMPLASSSDVPDLVDEQGSFKRNVEQVQQLWRGDHIRAQVLRELSLQLEFALDHGVRPTHFDSHHGVQKRPLVRSVLIELARSRGVPAARTHRGRYWTATDAPAGIRLRHLALNARNAHRIFMVWWNHARLNRAGVRTPDRKLTPDWLLPTPEGPRARLLATLTAMPPGTAELLAHPGYPDPEVVDSEFYAEARRIDTELMTDPEVREAIERAGIELVHFGALAPAPSA